MTDYVTKDPVTGELYDQTDKRPNTGSQINATKDARQLEYDKDVDEAQQYVYLGEVGKWKIGYICLRVTQRWSRDEEQKALIKFASDIRLAHPRQIYDIHQVAAFFPESAYAYITEQLQLVSWSHCREAVRHVADKKKHEGEIIELEKVMDWLKAANNSEINCEDFGASLKSGMVDTWLTKRKRVPAKIAHAYVRDADKPDDRIGIIELHVEPKHIQAILDLMKTTDLQKEFIEHLAMKWLEKRVDK